jgi:hypothetical protein
MSYICHCTPERTCELCEAMLADMPAATVAPVATAVRVDPFGAEYGARLAAEAITGQCIHRQGDPWEVAARMVADIAVAMVVMGKRGDFRVPTGWTTDVLATVCDLSEMYYRESLERLQEYTDL